MKADAAIADRRPPPACSTGSGGCPMSDPRGQRSAARFADTMRPRLSVPLIAAPMFGCRGRIS
jgi:hypothetical protein